VEPKSREAIDAFVRTVLERHQRAVFAAAYAKLRNRSDAEDVTQDVFVEAYRSANKLDNPEKLLPWLYETTGNLCKAHFRRRSRRERREAVFVERRSDNHPPESLDDAERGKALMSAINELPEELRAVFMLKRFAGSSYAEISKMMGLSKTTIDGRLRTAKKRLRKKLVDMGVGVD
jgi:RNA polymerase sigma-70 factor (ECF subfamily)